MKATQQRNKIGLDNPAFAGRLRADARSSSPVAFPARHRVDLKPQTSRVVIAPISPRLKVVKPQPFAKPAAPKLQSSRVLHRRALTRPIIDPPTVANSKFESRRTVKKDNKRAQQALLAMAAVVFMVGISTAAQAYRTNISTKKQVLALSAATHASIVQSTQNTATTDKSSTSNNVSSAQASSPVPSVSKLTTESIANYSVVGDAPRYIDIPVLQVHARVMPVGLLANGALGAPSNIHDTNWYKASAKPGLPGATVIDGHVSSWTAHGVFYDLKSLVVGDTMSVLRGDGMVIKYRVVKTAIYPASGVDMKAVLLPVTANKSGLNIISCTGSVKAGTSDFSKRIVVYSEQI